MENSQVRGMAVDKNDHLWVCCSGEGKVIEVDIESKTILRDLLMPKAKEVRLFHINMTSDISGGNMLQ